MNLRRWASNHGKNLISSLRHMAKSPIAAFMSIAVIGITLALPTGLYVLLDNLQQAVTGWEGKPRISLFLQKSITAEEAEALTKRIRDLKETGQVLHIPPEAGLEEFRQVSGFAEALDMLDSNPLPSVIQVDPAPGFETPQQVEELQKRLRNLGGVDLAQLDLEWVKRLHTMLELGKRGAWLLSAMLGLAILLIIGNTIRLAILNRRDEIVIIKLIGGSDAFIRRPFLYTGFLQGLLGGVTAWFLVMIGMALLSGPVQKLAVLYASDFALQPPGLIPSLVLLLAGSLLGWLGSRLAVARHLRDIQPA